MIMAHPVMRSRIAQSNPVATESKHLAVVQPVAAESKHQTVVQPVAAESKHLAVVQPVAAESIVPVLNMKAPPPLEMGDIDDDLDKMYQEYEDENVDNMLGNDINLGEDVSDFEEEESESEDMEMDDSDLLELELVH